MFNLNDFHGTQGAEYPKNRYEMFETFSSLSIPILEFLTGKPWGAIALAYVHGMHPSCIRVTTGIMTLDAWRDRVTVLIDEHGIIEKITQQIEVGLPEGVMHGSALREALQHGLDSEQVKRHRPET